MVHLPVPLQWKQNHMTWVQHMLLFLKHQWTIIQQYGYVRKSYNVQFRHHKYVNANILIQNKENSILLLNILIAFDARNFNGKSFSTLSSYSTRTGTWLQFLLEYNRCAWTHFTAKNQISLSRMSNQFMHCAMLSRVSRTTKFKWTIHIHIKWYSQKLNDAIQFETSFEVKFIIIRYSFRC